MGDQKTSIEWFVAEDEPSWQRMQAESIRDSTTLKKTQDKNKSLMRFYAVLAVTMLMLLITGGWLWKKANAGLAQMETEIAADAHQEVLPAHSKQSNSSTGLTVHHVAEQWLAQPKDENQRFRATFPDLNNVDQTAINTRIINLQNDVAVVEIKVKADSSARTYRQTQFYQRTDRGWLRRAPDSTLWGSAQHLETAHFVIDYRQHDAEVVAEISNQLDKLFESLTTDFGLDGQIAIGKIPIEVNVTGVSDHLSLYVDFSKPLKVTSPALYLVPDYLSNADILMQALCLQLIQRLSTQAIIKHHIPVPWQPLLNGFNLWQLWQGHLPLSIWHESMVKWTYTVDRERQQHRIPTPPHFSELCAMYHLWVITPLQINVPVACSDGDPEQSERLLWTGALPTPSHLADLTIPKAWAISEYPRNSAIESPSPPTEAVVIATLFEYLAKTYGQEQFPIFLAALNQYEEWETLLQAVYGISTPEVEADWRAYLVSQYGVEFAH